MSITVTRPYRRLLVAVFIGGTLGGLAVRTFAPELDALAKALQIVGPICGAFLFGWGWRSLNPQALDEREQQVRLDVYLRSYLILALVVLAVPLALTLIYAVSAPTAANLLARVLASFERPTNVLLALLALVPLVGLLPWAVLAWLQPDPLADERA